MTMPIDHGARCERHAGEVFLPRCTDCDTARSELEQQRAEARHQRALERNAALGIVPGRAVPRRRLARRR